MTRWQGTLTVQTVNGVATFSDLKLIKAARGYTLTATVTGAARHHQHGLHYHPAGAGDGDLHHAAEYHRPAASSRRRCR